MSIRPVVEQGAPSSPRSIEFCEKNRLASDQYERDAPCRTAWMEEHLFLWEANICIDERVQVFLRALGMLPGLLELYRSGGSKVGYRSLAYALRTQKAIQKASAVDIHGKVERKVKVRLCTAHHSSSRPDQSCVAWDHQTELALRAMRDHSQELYFAYPGKIVGIPGLIDTDVDALTLYGPNGTISVRDLVDDPRVHNGSRHGYIVDLLRRVFPFDWDQLRSLDPRFQERFHSELAERIEANIDFVIRTIESKRPPELLVHQGELLHVGRLVDWLDYRDHNSVILIDDTDDRDQVLEYFRLGLRFVALNTIKRAIQEGNRDWSVPVFVNIPHDDQEDELSTIIYTRVLVQDLKGELRACADDLVNWLLHSEEGIPKGHIPDWMLPQIRDVVHRTEVVASRSLRKSRRFRLLQLDD